LDEYKGCVGGTEESAARATARQGDVFSATFDRDDPPLKDGEAIPPGRHQFCVHEGETLSEEFG